MNTFSRFVASAAVPSVWCIDSAHLLRQETEKSSLNGRNVASSSQPRHGVIGAAILEAAGESTVTWPPLQREDQTQPVARAARTPKGEDAWQHVSASNSTFGARTMNYKQNVSSGAELQKQRSGPRRVPRNELDGEQSTDWLGATWDKPLSHNEGDSNTFPSDCTHTSQEVAEPGYWFVKFADGNLHYVSTVRLWNRDPGPKDRLNGACVRFSVDGTKPSSADPDSGCDFKLSEIDNSSGPESGTEIVIGRWIRGMMIITQRASHYPAPASILTICGIWIYEDTSATPPSTTTTTTTTPGEGDDTTPEQAGTIGVVIGVVVALAVVGAVLAVWSSGREGPTDATPDAY
mmetsp:Transcript_7947/g.19107  ORF Transcript_7947/g.19107 Transcript_7947/m.19107 type:complete len:348 (-) Transcript_7947:492-1535(-)|eukprot:CAMPEP_0178991790 /NCGR_PEP_ID=MMETSP0795-20121207/5736_1 /TAXON_ID=88552 /ORGANISM="Amoebophrya sp., Strain Ameob2" /LENGTH=347 /DNA_ID=CAMNT_0020683563 /DNA_START=106 /DNA_END=1149 /DNA_ORIENTATION=+